MKLDKELFERGCNQKEICSVIDDDYVLIRKKMPVEDSNLDNYINAINMAKNSGINICRIVDYKLIDGKTSTYSNASYTTGIFIEERAKGSCLDSNNLYDAKVEDIDRYLENSLKYIDELENRSMAPSSIYDKLVNDYISLNKYNLEADPKPLNFFFDREKGYSIIDVIPSGPKTNEEFYPRYIFGIVFGYGKPFMLVKNIIIKSLPLKLAERYKEIFENIEAKIVSALRKNGISQEIIQEELVYISKLYDKNVEVMEKEEIEELVKEKLEEEKNEVKPFNF